MEETQSWFPEQGNHHKNKECHSTVEGQLERHVEEEEKFPFPSDVCWLQPAAGCKA